MYKTFVNSFKVSFAENANSFIYFLKRVPIIGKRVSDNLYKETNAKITIGIISEIWGFIKSILKKFLYLGVMLILPAELITQGKELLFPYFLHMFFFLNLIFGSFINTVIFNNADKMAYDMIVLMRAEARRYYISAILYKNITNFIYFILPMIISGFIVGFTPLQAFTLLIILTAFRFIGEAVNLFLYNKTRVDITKKSAFIIIFALIVLGLSYVLPILGFSLSLKPVFFNIYIVLIIIVLGSAALIYLWSYKGYNVIAKELLTRENIFDIQKFQTDMTFADVKLNEDKVSKEELTSKLYENKHGYDYLNALFFNRHRKMLVNPIKYRVIVIAVIFLGTSAALLFIPQARAEVGSVILKSTPLLVFIMYLINTGERICKAMFYNCDSSLLRYTYYREPKTILLNFTIRLKKAVLLNIIPAVALCMAIAGILIIAGFGSKLLSMIPLFLCILCLACFFSIHNMFMYYVIQPYTAQLTIKSPLYKTINFIVYMVSYGCLRVKTSSSIFTLGVLIVTIIYIAVALLLTYRVAPRTFKLR